MALSSAYIIASSLPDYLGKWSVVLIIALTILIVQICRWIFSFFYKKKINQFNSTKYIEEIYRKIQNGSSVFACHWHITSTLDSLEYLIKGKNYTAKTIWQRSWCMKLFYTVFSLAFIYPAFSLIMQWIISGQSLKFAAVEIMPEKLNFWWERAVVLICMIIILLAFVFIIRFFYQKKYTILPLILSGIRGLSLVLLEVGLLVFAFTVAAIVAGAIGIALGLTLEHLFGLEMASKLTEGLAFLFAFIMAVAGVVIMAKAGMKALARIDKIAVVITIIGILGIAGAVAIVKIDVLFLFVLLLPIVNAVFNFCSIGATRYFLRLGLKYGFLGIFIVFIVNLIIGVFLFSALIYVTIATIHIFHMLTKADLLNFATLWAQIKAEPNQFWWLYLTFFSTLLPTLLHVGVVCAAFFDRIMRLVLPEIEKELKAVVKAYAEQEPRTPEQDAAAERGLKSLAIAQAVGVMMVFVAAYTLLWALTNNIGNIMGSLVWIFESWAAYIGALPA